MLEEENINIIITIGAVWFLRKYTLPERKEHKKRELSQLSPLIAPSPAFEIIKVGKMWGKRKNAEKHSNITIYQLFTIILNFNPN